MQKSRLLRCGLDTIGSVTWETGENWHNYGRLEPGPDYWRYQEPLEQLWAADQALEELLESEQVKPDEELQQAEERKEDAYQKLGKFDLYLEETDTHQVQSIHDFHIIDAHGGVYWRYGNSPSVQKS